MASAFLLFMNPEAYTVIDQYAWAALLEAGHVEEELSGTPTVNEYVEYLGACHALAVETGVSLRMLDEALWMMGR